MPEATVLYSVTGVVVVGLIAWVSMVLAKAKEPWARPAPPEEPAAAEVAPEARTDEAPPDSEAQPEAKSSGLNADDTARATPVALSEGRQKAASETTEADEKADEEKKAEA